MYRPTIRCHDVYRHYLDQLSDVTGLDRNQLIRLALFSAPFSNLFVAQIKQKCGDVPLPSPPWEVFNHQLWMEQDPKLMGEGDGVNANLGRTKETQNATGSDEQPRRTITAENRRKQPIERRTREIRKRETGGISIRIGSKNKITQG